MTTEKLKETDFAYSQLLNNHSETIMEHFAACCPNTSVELFSSYFEGSYLDHAHTEYYAQCACCKKRIKLGYEMHSWYG